MARIAGPSRADIEAWEGAFPWSPVDRVEQDLVLSRMLIEIYRDELLFESLAFRGGTALHKLHLPRPRRYSEDIDLVMGGPGEPEAVINRLREVLEPLIGRPRTLDGPLGIQLLYSPASLVAPSGKLGIKIDISVPVHHHFDEPCPLPLQVVSPWFSGQATLHCYSPEETLASKLQALIRRNQLRDLYDLDWALADRPDLDCNRLTTLAPMYAEQDMYVLHRPIAEQVMLEKFEKIALLAGDGSSALEDIVQMVPLELQQHMTFESFKQVFARVFIGIVSRLGGQPWSRTDALVRDFELVDAFAEAEEDLSGGEDQLPIEPMPT